MNLISRQLRGNSAGPHVLILGGVHGDEFEPMAAARELIRVIPQEVLRGSVTIVPVVNEPAYLRGHRTAEDQRDLARTFPGREDGSITERIAHAATQLIGQADYVIDLHTGGTQWAVTPMVGYMLHADADVLAAQRRMARAFGLPVIWGTSAGLDGRSLSVCRDAGVPAIYAEYQGSAVCHDSGVDAYVDGCLRVLAELELLPRDAISARAQQPVPTPVLSEDPRPNSGHLQICNPSPCTGYWHSYVRLGQSVQSGDLLGTVSDLLGDQVVRIESQQSGIVIVLRTYPRVFQEDALATVMEML